MRFDPADGSKPTQSTVQTGTLAAPPQRNPQRQGFLFDGWTLDGQPFDLQTPILQDTILKAQWSKATDWTLSPDHGPATGTRLTINPPDRQEPCYVSIQAAGDQFIGLTGDGRIYVWKQDSTPKQVPAPAQAPEGFRYLQATTGSRWQAALGSNQHIYTWNNGQSTPTILDSEHDAGFISISMNGDRLLAVDRQGRVHIFQTSQDDSQNLNPKPAEQASLNLPEQAQAVTAVASGSQALIVDADGQAWTWDTNNTGKAKPASIKQAQDMRIIQTQALNHGFLLLDADGQAWYLAVSTTDIATVSLPEGMKATRFTVNKNQAMIVDEEGHVWAWKPGSKTIWADDGNQQYMQAASIGSRITAIDRQGDMFTWSLNPQNNPGKPARLNTTQAPTLETASMDRQPFKLSRNNGSWQTEIPARQPGPAAILITGRQDGQPFTRSLNYTVDQPLTREAEPGSTHTVTFNADGGSPEPAGQNFSTLNSRVKRPSPDPTREGYLFDGWFINEVAYDFSRPVTKDLTLTAKWTSKNPNNTWKINPNKGSQLGNEATTITPPSSISGVKFNQISGAKSNGSSFSLAVGSDGNAYAWGNNTYGQLGDGTTTQRSVPVIVKEPERTTYPDLPSDFTYVQVSAGAFHSVALGSDGYVYAWGRNNYGQLGNNTSGTFLYSTVPVRVRDPASPTDTSKGLHATQVSGGYQHSLAVGSDGYVYAWGWNKYGQLGNNTSNYDANPVPIHVRDPASPTDTSKGLQATQVSAGYAHSLAVGSDEYAYAWGYNWYGQLGNNTPNGSNANPVPIHVRDPASPTDTSKGLQATQVSAGLYHSLAVGSDGYTYAWGQNGDGQLGNNSTTDSAFPDKVRDPASTTDTSKGLQATQVSGGTNHSLAVGSDGQTYAWGYNKYGQLGNGTSYSNSSVPVHVRDPASPTDTSKGLQATQVSGGTNHSLAVGSDGQTYAWGYNNNSQLGDDTTNNKITPVPVSFNLQPMITGVRFDQNAVSGLTRGDGSSVTVLTPVHLPGMVTVSVDYTLGAAGRTLTDKSLTYTYLPAGVLPRAGGEGILLALATGMTGMGGVLASRRHRREQHRLTHASHE